MFRRGLVFVLLSVIFLQTINGGPLPSAMIRLGRLSTRSASEIKSSNWTLGCETLDRDFADFDAYREYVAPLGIKTIRLQAGWAKCEKVKGAYDFSWLDRIVDYVRERGINVLLETDYGNPIYAGGGGWDLAGGFPKGEEGLLAWDAWVDAISRHFSGKVRDWAMWNEPDGYSCKERRTPKEIAEFNLRTARIIRRNIPDARLAGLSLAHNRVDFFEECLKAMGSEVALFDWFIYHGYAAAPESSYESVEAMKEVLARYHPHAKMRQGENGAPSEMATRFALGGIPWSECSQAKWDMRRMLGDLGHDVESSVFTVCDFNHKGREINRKGLLRADEDKNVIDVKWAYYAVQRVASVFDDRWTRVRDATFGTPDWTIVTYEYADSRDVSLYVFWVAGDSVPDAGPNEKAPGTEKFKRVWTRPGETMEKRQHVFSAAAKPLSDPVWVDLLTGDVYEFPRQNVKVSRTCVRYLRVPVYDSPCLLTERSAVGIVD